MTEQHLPKNDCFYLGLGIGTIAGGIGGFALGVLVSYILPNQINLEKEVEQNLIPKVEVRSLENDDLVKKLNKNYPPQVEVKE